MQYSVQSLTWIHVYIVQVTKAPNWKMLHASAW